MTPFTHSGTRRPTVEYVTPKREVYPVSAVSFAVGIGFVIVAVWP